VHVLDLIDRRRIGIASGWGGSNQGMADGNGSGSGRTRPLLAAESLTAKPQKGSRISLSSVGLFAGIGGIELGLQAAGHEPRLLCEADRAASAVLSARFPGMPLHGDVRTLGSLPKGTDLVAAGFPCQDLSQAGATAGIGGSRSRLILEVFELLRKAKRARRSVPWLLLENVSFMLRLRRGRAMAVIIAALEDLGYRWACRSGGGGLTL
jgi:site-specific DNA-cytosine methylase